jgi:hypothetical protein
MDPLFVISLLFNRGGGEGNMYFLLFFFLFCSFYTPKWRSIKLLILLMHGSFALIRLLCEVPATHPLGTEP